MTTENTASDWAQYVETIESGYEFMLAYAALGDHHYVVGDIKSSGRPRSDQVLQVAFYSRLLAAVQEQPPEYGYLILKDGHEERFALADIEDAFEDVIERVEAVRRDPDSERPFLSPACARCHWSELCIPGRATTYYEAIW